LERAEDASTAVCFTSSKAGNASLLQLWKAYSDLKRGSTGRLNLLCGAKKNFSAKKALKTKQEVKAFQSSKKGQNWTKLEVEMQKMY